MSEKCSDCGKKEALYYAGGQIDSYKYCLECWANNSEEPVTELLANQKSEVCQKDKSWHLAESEELAKMVEELGDDIYPSDVFTELTELDKYVMRGIEENHPNLLARLYSDAARRTFRIAGKKIRETIEEEE